MIDELENPSIRQKLAFANIKIDIGDQKINSKGLTENRLAEIRQHAGLILHLSREAENRQDDDAAKKFNGRAGEEPFHNIFNLIHALVVCGEDWILEKLIEIAPGI